MYDAKVDKQGKARGVEKEKRKNESARWMDSPQPAGCFQNPSRCFQRLLCGPRTELTLSLLLCCCVVPERSFEVRTLCLPRNP